MEGPSAGGTRTILISFYRYAFAVDMGVPMIIPTMYFMVLALIPIILIEGAYISKALRIPFSKTIGSVILSNVISTLAGLPFTWLLLFIVQVLTGGLSSYGFSGFASKILSVTLQAPWLLPFRPEEFWVFHSAGLFLLIPFFFATWLIEYAVMRNRLATGVVDAGQTPDVNTAERMVLRATRDANLISYGLIGSLLVLSLILQSVRGSG